MASILKLRRGSSTQNDSFTGAEGEVTFDTTNKTLRVHDGSTSGGIKLAKDSERDDNLSVANANVLFADRMQVANTVSLVNAKLANTNAYIAAVSATERSALANTNSYIDGIAGARLGDTSTVTLTGDVTATATAFSSNAVSVSTTLTNSGVNAGTYGNSTAISVVTIDTKGRVTSATTADVAGVTSVNYYGANATLRIATADGTNFDTAISTNDKMSVANTITLVNTKLANTNAYIASVSATERSALANTNAYIASVSASERSALANTNSRIATTESSISTNASTERSALANTNSYIASQSTTNRTYTDDSIAALANSAPVTLNTLNELAAALGDDNNFATTLTTNLGQKLGSTATVTLTGDVSGTANFSSNTVSVTTVVADDSHNHVISNVDGLQTAIDTKATWTGLTGTNTAIRTLVSDRMQVANTVTLLADKLNTSGGIISGHLIPSANVTYDLGSPTKAFRELYLSGSTLTLGGLKLQESTGSLVVKDSATDKEVTLSSSLGVVVDGKTVIASDGSLDDDSVGKGFSGSTVYLIPEDYGHDDSYIGQSASGLDAFGVALGKVYNCMEPIGRAKAVDYGTL